MYSKLANYAGPRAIFNPADQMPALTRTECGNLVAVTDHDKTRLFVRCHARLNLRRPIHIAPRVDMTLDGLFCFRMTENNDSRHRSAGS